MLISRATNIAPEKWRATAVLQSLQLDRETLSVTNRDLSLASDMEQLTDNNTILHEAGHQLNKLSKTMTAPIPKSRLQMNNSDSTIIFKDEEHAICPMFDIKLNENQSQNFMLPFKRIAEENSYKKNSYVQNEESHHPYDDRMNKVTEICRINLLKENRQQMNSIVNVSETSGLKMISFEDLLQTQNQLHNLTYKTSAGLTLQCEVAQRPLEGCHDCKGTEVNTNEEPLVLSCDMFSTNNDSLFNDKLQNIATLSETIETGLNEVATQSPRKFREDDFNNFQSELCEKCPSSRTQTLMTVTFINEHLRECVSSQDEVHKNNVEIENLEMAVPEDGSHKISNQDTDISPNCLLHVADFQSNATETLQKIQFFHGSHKTIELKTHESSKELETLDQSQYKEEVLPPVGQQSSKVSTVEEQKFKNKFLRGTHYMPMKRKLEVPGVFQKTGKIKGTLCSDKQTAYSEVPISSSKTETSSAMNMKDVIANTCVLDGRNVRKTTFQAPFKKIPSEGKQVHKET